MSADLKNVVERLEKVAACLERACTASCGGSGAAAPSGGAVAESGAAMVSDYDALVAEHIPALKEAADKIDADVSAIVDKFQAATTAQRAMLNVAAQSKKPADVTPFLQPTADLMAEITAQRDGSRGHKFFNQLSAISEGSSALGWVAVSPTPGPFVDEGRASAEFYTNKLLREYRGKDETQVAFVTKFIGFLKGLRAYIKDHHTTGVSWNAKGGDAVAPSAAPAAGGAPPPPPPSGGLSADDIAGMSKSSKSAEEAAQEREKMLAELAAIRERQEKTGSSGLRKVTKDMKSKNQPAKSSVVPAKKAPARSSASKRPNKPAVLELQGNKWVVEYQYDNREVVIKDTEVRQVVYIYKCENSVIQIKGKINAVTMDGCKKVGLVFDSAVASCEVINSTSVQVQCTGKTPSMSIDNTNGCQLFLSREGMATEVITSKSSELNVNVPGKTDNDDPVEMAVPEQFVTKIVDGKLVTETVAHEG